jgi:hypothetical protein
VEESELITLLSADGLRLLDSLPLDWAKADVVRTVSRLRSAGHPAHLVAAVLNQAKLRRRARAKFGEFADRMLFTEAGLEQATRLTVAAMHAGRFRAAGLNHVADLGCGIGGDALAMAALGLHVTAVERDPVTAAIAAYNLAPWENAIVENADVERAGPAWLARERPDDASARNAVDGGKHGTAREHSTTPEDLADRAGPTASDSTTASEGASARDDPTTAAHSTTTAAHAPDANRSTDPGEARREPPEASSIDGLYLDPARRDGVRRLKDPADWSPSLEFAFDLAGRLPTGVKLAPGMDRTLIPSSAEAQWVSVDREVVEVGLWFGALARPGVRRAALLLGAHGTAELTAASDSEDVGVGPLGEYLYEPDGAVIRARLIGDLGRRIDATMLSRGIAYLTADAAVDTPFATRFRIIESLPFDRRMLKKALAARNIGTLEIKKRGVDVDPARLRTSLALRGEASATLIVTRVAGRHAALLAEREQEAAARD